MTEPEAGTAAPAVAEPVDMAAIDRDRDVFGFVVDHTGAAVAGATVRLVRYPFARLDGFSAKEIESVDAEAVSTADDGSFVLRCERAEEVALRVTASGFAAVERRFCLAGGKLRIVMRGGVRLVFEAKDESGAPVAGVHISNFKTKKGWATKGDGAYLLPEGVTGKDGRYVCEGAFSNGRIGVLAWHPEYGVPDGEPFTLPADGEHVVKVELFGGRTIRGRVTDAKTGAGVGGVRSSPIPMLKIKAVVTDSHGTYAYPAWPEGEGDIWGQLFAIKQGYALAQEEVKDRSRVDFELARGWRTEGVLVNAEGKPVAGAFVHALMREGNEIDTHDATSDAEGRFVIPNLRAGNHTLLILARGYAKHRVQFDSGMEDLGRIVLAAGLRLEGRIQPAKEFVQVRLSGPGKPKYGRYELRHTDDLGRFRFTDLPAGSYALTVRDPDDSQVSRMIELKEDLTGLLIRFDSGSFTVRVRDTRNAAVEGALVFLANRRKRTDARGEVRFEHKEPFRFPVFVKAGREGLLDSGYVQCAADQSPLDVVLKDAAYIAGRVELEGEPLAGVAVSGRSGERSIQGHTDAEGRFKLKVPAGARLDLSMTGRVGDRTQPIVGELKGVLAGSEELVLRARRLEMGRSLRVRVTTPSGDGLRGIRIEVWPRFGNRAQLPLTDAQGRAELTGLPEVEVTVTAWPDPRVDAWEKWCRPEVVRVIPNGQEVVLAFRDAVPIEGLVVLPDGKPVHIVVAAYREGRRWQVAQTGTDEQGHFRLNIPADEPEPVRIEVDPANNRMLAEANLKVAVIQNVLPGTRDLRIQLERR